MAKTQVQKNRDQNARDEQHRQDADLLVDLGVLPFEKSDDLKEIRSAKQQWLRMTLDEPGEATKRLARLKRYA